MIRLRNIVLIIGCLMILLDGQIARSDTLYPPDDGAEENHTATVLNDIGLAYEISTGYVDPTNGYINHNAIAATGVFGLAGITLEDYIRSSPFTVPSTGDYIVTIDVSVRGLYYNISDSFFFGASQEALGDVVD